MFFHLPILFFLFCVTTEAMAAEHPYTNRLIHEKSPYLLQHAHNPVDWYSWGPEAFEKARKENKPIFLSIGYSTCHWCHVMEEESFEDPETANFLNEHFVPIKVDREERPDVDQIYMAAVMAMTGSGGWPLSAFLTPDLKPFYGGTYYPKTDQYGVPGFLRVLRSISQSWKDNPAALLTAGENLTEALHQQLGRRAGQETSLTPQVLDKAFQQHLSNFDWEYGGFGNAPKFPRSHALSFLLRYHKRTKNKEALNVVLKTLDAMAAGGMYDQIGGGFHRYSVDERWHVPHFEKMLYDQALLSKTYLEAFQITHREEYARIAREIFDCVLREMTSPEGGFFCAQDADSAPDAAKPKEKKEGAVYVWEETEIFKILGKETGAIFSYAYGVEATGNAASDPHGEFINKNILYRSRTDAQVAGKFSKDPQQIRAILEEARKKLFAARSKRPVPHLDDKVLTDWNGLFISSLAMGFRVLGEPRYRDAAIKAADFIAAKMRSADGRLLHRYRKGAPPSPPQQAGRVEDEAGIPATLEDHAFLVHGLLDLFQAVQDPKYLEQANHWAGEMIQLFWDEKEGGFFLSPHDAQGLIARTKEAYDGAIPSGNSVAALDLLRLGRMTMNRSLEDQASKIFSTFSGAVAAAPYSYTQMLMALDFTFGPDQEIVIAGDLDTTGVQAMIASVYARFLPNALLIVHPDHPAPAKSAIEKLIPFAAQQNPVGGKPTAYVCQNYACQKPITDIVALEKLLE